MGRENVRGVHHAEGRAEGEEGEEEGGGTRGTVSSKRGPSTTGWLGKTSALFNVIAHFEECTCIFNVIGHFEEKNICVFNMIAQF